MGSPPGPVAGGAPRVWRASPHIAYVTPSRLATRTASSNSNSACACHTRTASSNRAQRVRALAFRTQLTSEELCGDRLASVKLKERGGCGGGGLLETSSISHSRRAVARWGEATAAKDSGVGSKRPHVQVHVILWKAAAPCGTLAETNCPLHPPHRNRACRGFKHPLSAEIYGYTALLRYTQL